MLTDLFIKKWVFILFYILMVMGIGSLIESPLIFIMLLVVAYTSLVISIHNSYLSGFKEHAGSGVSGLVTFTSLFMVYISGYKYEFIWNILICLFIFFIGFYLSALINKHYQPCKQDNTE